MPVSACCQTGGLVEGLQAAELAVVQDHRAHLGGVCIALTGGGTRDGRGAGLGRAG